MLKIKFLEERLKNKHYQRFYKQKQKLRSKYPPIIFPDYDERKYKRRATKEERILYREYLTELSKLIFRPDGDYQKFCWETLSVVEKREMENKARGLTYGRKQEMNYY